MMHELEEYISAIIGWKARGGAWPELLREGTPGFGGALGPSAVTAIAVLVDELCRDFFLKWKQRVFLSQQVQRAVPVGPLSLTPDTLVTEVRGMIKDADRGERLLEFTFLLRSSHSYSHQHLTRIPGIYFRASSTWLSTVVRYLTVGRF